MCFPRLTRMSVPQREVTELPLGVTYRRQARGSRHFVPFFACVAPALLVFAAVNLPWGVPHRGGASLHSALVANCTMTGSCGGDPSGSPPSVLITVVLFGFFGTGYVCVHPSGSTCQYKLGSLDGFIANTSGTYTLKALDPNPAWAFNHWISNAGTFGSPNSVQTSFTTSGGGYVGFVMNQTAPSAWAGYATGMIGNGSDSMPITYAEGTFTIPSVSWVPCAPVYCFIGGNYQETLGIWVGLGNALSSNNIWQAGVDIDISPKVGGGYTTTVNPWYEWIPGPPTYLRNWIQPNVGDKLRVVVWNNNSQSSYYFQDLTNSQRYGGTISGAPPSDSAEWVAEDENTATVVMPRFSSFIFVNPVVSATCTGPYGCSFGTTWMLPIEQRWIDATHQTGIGTYVTQKVFPSTLASNLTEFTDTYS